MLLYIKKTFLFNVIQGFASSSSISGIIVVTETPIQLQRNLVTYLTAAFTFKVSFLCIVFLCSCSQGGTLKQTRKTTRHYPGCVIPTSTVLYTQKSQTFVVRAWQPVARNQLTQRPQLQRQTTKCHKSKTQSFTATEGKNTTPQPHHDIAFWSRLDRGKMHIHEVSNL